MEGTGPAHQLSTPLSCQLTAMSQDLDWTLAHFMFVANATTLAEECDIVCSPTMSVANYHGLPFPALAFLGKSPELLSNYTSFLIDTDSEFTLIANEVQRPVAEAAFTILEMVPEWQMLFHGVPETLDAGGTSLLKPKHLGVMQNLAESTHLASFEQDPFSHGPAFGIWEGRTLVAMGTTHLSIPKAVEIGSIATHPEHRHRGYATSIIAALIRAHHAEGKKAFLMIHQRENKATAFYEQLGFKRERPMYLMRCRAKGSTIESY